MVLNQFCPGIQVCVVDPIISYILEVLGGSVEESRDVVFVCKVVESKEQEFSLEVVACADRVVDRVHIEHSRIDKLHHDFEVVRIIIVDLHGWLRCLLVHVSLVNGTTSQNSHPEATSECFEEEPRLATEHSTMSIVLGRLALPHLENLDIGEHGAVEESASESEHGCFGSKAVS